MDRRFEAATSLIRLTLKSPPPIPALAEKLGVSPSTLRRMFKEHSGMSPLQYMKRLRMHQAENLFRTTDLSVKEVAGMVGCNDVSHFVKDFSRVFRCSPGRYRYRNRQLSE